MTPRKQTEPTTATTATTTTPQTDALSGVQFAPEPKAKAKADPTRPRCAHDGCALFPQAEQGNGLCVNHQPAERRITRSEAEALSAWLEGLTPAERLVAFVRATGWHEAKALAKDEGQRTLSLA